MEQFNDLNLSMSLASGPTGVHNATLLDTVTRRLHAEFYGRSTSAARENAMIYVEARRARLQAQQQPQQSQPRQTRTKDKADKAPEVAAPVEAQAPSEPSA